MTQREDLSGKRFGRLLVVGEDERTSKGKYYWKCICDCGNTHAVYSGNLKAGNTQSCGCLHDENARIVNLKHGLCRRHPLYSIWKGIRVRCYNKNAKAYHRYGGRGITMCQRWYDDAAAFVSDMKPRPSSKHSIDRIDNDGGYWCGKCDECIENNWPANCRWATRKKQANNRDQSYCTGENSCKSRLTEQDVLLIREICVPGSHKLGFSSLARKYGVDPTTIRYAYYGRSWKHI